MRLNHTIQELVGRYDAQVFDLARPSARIRLTVRSGPVDSDPVDVVLSGHHARLEPAGVGRADSVISADEATWERVAANPTGGLEAFRRGGLTIRNDLHLGVGFLAATSGSNGVGLRFRQIRTAVGAISVTEAGSGPPVILIHGLGATKVSFLPTLAALAPTHRAIALDLPGFGDSVKPLRAPYHAPYFARAVVALMDALELKRADLIGNSMGGRVAIEVGLRFGWRAGRLGLLAPSLAWLRGRGLAPLLRFVPPQLGLLQPTSRSLMEAIVRRVIPEAQQGWTAAGVDEFLRSYLTPRGRAAFYAAARNIYLEEPYGEHGLWTRLPDLQAPSLFVWGRRDKLVPIGFEAHVREVLPSAAHLELNCGHVPQLEAPRRTHDALLKFLAA